MPLDKRNSAAQQNITGVVINTRYGLLSGRYDIKRLLPVQFWIPHTQHDNAQYSHLYQIHSARSMYEIPTPSNDSIEHHQAAEIAHDDHQGSEHCLQ